jgi:hypothetical protein
MKRSKPLKEIMKILEKWQDSKMELKTANQILTKLEKLDIICPPPYLKTMPGTHYFLNHENKMVPITEVEVMEWESEK